MPYIGNPPAERFTSFDYQDLTGGSGTSFTLDNAVGNPQEIEVFVNNVRQEPGVAYTVSGTALTMTGSIASTDDFYVVFQGKAIQTATHPSDRALTATDGTFTGDLTVDTNTLKVDAANNRVGIGTTSVDAALHTEVSSGNTIAKFENTISTAGTLGEVVFAAPNRPAFRFNMQTSNDTNGFLNYDNAEWKFFGDNGSGSAEERLRLNSSNDVFLPDGNLILASGHGIDFSATGSGDDSTGQTVQAELLNDYEHGLWTPTVNGDTTYHHQYGMYQKIGRQVTAWFRLKINAANTPGANFYMDGLPYNNDHNGFISGFGLVFYFSSIATSTTMITCRIDGGGSTINFTSNVGSSTTANNVNIPWVANNAEVQGGITYMTDYT